MVIAKVTSREGAYQTKGANARLLTHRRGCVTNWYQSMVTTLDLLGLMDESLKNSIWSTFKRTTLYLTSFLKSLI
jgi:hypothetical protein